MSTTTKPPAGSAVPTGWYRPADCDLVEFRRVVEQTTDLGGYRYADDVVENVVVYGERLRTEVRDLATRREVQAELARALQSGPGIVLFRGVLDADEVDRASAAFTRLIEEQKRSGGAAGDHFAEPGANDRVWGALDSLAGIPVPDEPRSRPAGRLPRPADPGRAAAARRGRGLGDRPARRRARVPAGPPALPGPELISGRLGDRWDQAVVGPYD